MDENGRGPDCCALTGLCTGAADVRRFFLEHARVKNLRHKLNGETISVVSPNGVMSITEPVPCGWNHIAVTGNGSVYNQI